MKNYKKWLALFISLSLIGTLSACSGGSSSTTESAAENTTTTAAKTTTEETSDVETTSAEENTDEDATSSEDETEAKKTSYEFGNLGSATEMEGTTVLYSIYASDSNYTWDWENDKDLETYDDMYDYTAIAADWLTEQAANYDCNATFIYDYNVYPDITCDATMDGDILDNNESDYIAWPWIDDNIDSESILEEYNADNIVYLIFINTPENLDTTSCTRNYYEGMEYPYEMCYIYSHCDGGEETPAAIAHEILHTFGAPDLYQADTNGDNYGITKKYVKMLDEEWSNDIMYTTFDCETQEAYYDHISNDFTEIDAYYTGLTDHSDTVDEWGFYPSEHER